VPSQNSAMVGLSAAASALEFTRAITFDARSFTGLHVFEWCLSSRLQRNPVLCLRSRP